MNKVVHNGRLQLLASLLNTMAASSFTVGVVAPIAASFFYGASSFSARTVLVGVIVWIAIASVLHLIGQYVLGGLRE